MDQRPRGDLVGQGLEDGQVGPLGGGQAVFCLGISRERERRPVQGELRSALLIEDILPAPVGYRYLEKIGFETLIRGEVKSE